VSTYQGFGQAMSFTALALMAMFPKTAVAAMVLAATVPVLYVLSSRSDFAAFVATFVLWLGVQFFAKPRAPKLAIGAIVAVFVFTALIVGGAWTEGRLSSVPTGQSQTAQQEQQLRHTGLVDLKNDASWQQRVQFLRAGVADIKASPLFGIYAGQIKSEGAWGDYIHNVLSVWATYGLVPFLLFCGLMVWSVAAGARRVVLQRDDDPRWTFLLYGAVFCLVMMLGAKSVYWALPSMMWGLSMRSREEIAAGCPSPTMGAISPPASSSTRYSTGRVSVPRRRR
jgi:predicted PurR-regulated permease PerM